MKWHFLGMAFAAALAGCSTKQVSDPVTVFGTVEASYAGAVAAEVSWLTVTKKPDPALVTAISNYRLQAHAVLAPIEAEIQAGSAPATVEVLAAESAVTLLTTYLQSAGIMKVTP